jgi:hypothetical protein
MSLSLGARANGLRSIGAGGVSVQWDAHSNLVENHEKMCGMTDVPIAGQLRDLKQRGLLELTLVIWEPSSGGCRCPRVAPAGITMQGFHDVVR